MSKIETINLLPDTEPDRGCVWEPLPPVAEVLELPLSYRFPLSIYRPLVDMTAENGCVWLGICVVFSVVAPVLPERSTATSSLPPSVPSGSASLAPRT